MRNASLIAAAMLAFSYDQVRPSWPDAPKTKTGRPTGADFARLDKAQAKRDKRAERNLRNAK